MSLWQVFTYLHSILILLSWQTNKLNIWVYQKLGPSSQITIDIDEIVDKFKSKTLNTLNDYGRSMLKTDYNKNRVVQYFSIKKYDMKKKR